MEFWFDRVRCWTTKTLRLMVTTFLPAYLIINSAYRDRKEHKDRDSESRVKKCGRQMHGRIERLLYQHSRSRLASLFCVCGNLWTLPLRAINRKPKTLDYWPSSCSPQPAVDQAIQPSYSSSLSLIHTNSHEVRLSHTDVSNANDEWGRTFTFTWWWWRLLSSLLVSRSSVKGKLLISSPVAGGDHTVEWAC